MDFAASQFEYKQINDAGHIEGLAAGFGDVDDGGDILAPGSLTKSLHARGDRPIPMLLHHAQDRPVGVWTEWQERGDGLYLKGKLSLAARDAQEAHALARDGALTGLSIGYIAEKAHHQGKHRVLAEVALHETSLVTFPMHPRARVTSIKSIAGARDLETMLREAGFSSRKSKAAASAAWRAINDAPDEATDLAEIEAILTASAERIAGL